MYGEILECIGETDWEGDDCSVTCPCGHRIEPDNPGCNEGCQNPIVASGMI